MFDIKLKVNNFFKVFLGMPLNVDELKRYGIGKVGFFMKSSTSEFKKEGDEVYWVKNPVISCFNDFQTTTIGGSKDAPWNTPADMLCGTSVILYFNKGSLRLVVVQVIMSKYWAESFTEHFRNNAIKEFGINGSRFAPVLEWNNGNSFIKSSLIDKNAYLFWGKNE